MFPATSRYFNIEVATIEIADGRTVSYLRRRFLPDGSKAVILAEHMITQGERLDNITARYLGDPESFWLLCDANNAMAPDDLTADSEIGNRLIIPLPQGG
ncbi:MAG: LysM domain-containing protein [Chloracidobacterium sp.]|nr:LysM domain-containing protein [Chloracidobacterium sp.]